MFNRVALAVAFIVSLLSLSAAHAQDLPPRPAEVESFWTLEGVASAALGEGRFSEAVAGFERCLAHIAEHGEKFPELTERRPVVLGNLTESLIGVKDKARALERLSELEALLGAERAEGSVRFRDLRARARALADPRPPGPSPEELERQKREAEAAQRAAEATARRAADAARLEAEATARRAAEAAAKSTEIRIRLENARRDGER